MKPKQRPPGPQDITSRARNLLNSSGGKKGVMTFKELTGLNLPQPDYLLRGLARGDLGLLQAITNGGKTTLLQCLAESLAAGRSYEPIYSGGKPLKVALLDYETPIERGNEDLQRQRATFTEEEQKLIDENLSVYFYRSRISQPFFLSDPVEFEAMLLMLKERQVDLAITDTFGSAFPGVNEMDAHDISMNLIARLTRLVNETGGATLMSHHIGKEKSEEGRSHQGVHRSRGSSKIPGEHQLIMTLDTRKIDGVEERIFYYDKDKRLDEDKVIYKTEYDPDTRWVELVTGDRKTSKDAKYNLIVDTINETGGIPRKDLLARLNGQVGSDATFDRLIKRAVKAKEIESVGGVYLPITLE